MADKIKVKAKDIPELPDDMDIEYGLKDFRVNATGRIHVEIFLYIPGAEMPFGRSNKNNSVMLADLPASLQAQIEAVRQGLFDYCVDTAKNCEDLKAKKAK